jgi:hypothetical protein
MMAFGSWDDDYSQLNGKYSSYVPNHPPVMSEIPENVILHI